MPTTDRRTQRRESNHRAIAAAALRLIRERGAQGLSVDELAERAGVSRRTVFNHFASIEEAAVAQTLWEFDELSARLPVPRIPAQAPLPEVAARLLADLVERPEALRLMQDLSALSRELAGHPSVAQWSLRSAEHSLELFSQRVLTLRPAADPQQVRVLGMALIAACAVALETPSPAADAAGSAGPARSADPEAVDVVRQRVRDALHLLAGIPADLGT